jgi:hypothetical protein
MFLPAVLAIGMFAAQAPDAVVENTVHHRWSNTGSVFFSDPAYGHDLEQVRLPVHYSGGDEALYALGIATALGSCFVFRRYRDVTSKS